MVNENDGKPAPGAVKQTSKAGAKALGVIVYNTALDTWRAFDASKRLVQSGSKKTLLAKFPNFTVKE